MRRTLHSFALRSKPAAGPRWECEVIALLVAALRARDERIARLEQLDCQKAQELDRLRREQPAGARRAA